MKIMSFNVNNWGGRIEKPQIRNYSEKGHTDWRAWNTAVDLWRSDNFQTIQSNVRETVKLINSHDIVFLHEVDTNCDSWELLRKELINNYKLELPNGYDNSVLLKGRKSISCAFIKNEIEYAIDSDNFSKELKNIQIQVADIAIVGVHVPIRKEYWKNLQNVKADIILGDFNAGDYERATKMNEYKTLLDMGYCDICGGAITTVYNTPIDHILISTKYKDKCFHPIIHSDILLSDHYPISFELAPG